MKRGWPEIPWDQHHAFVAQALSRTGGPNQLYDDILANDGLRRVGNGLWNLLPLPRSVHQWIHASEIGRQVLAIIYYAIIAYGPTNAILAFFRD